MGGGSVACRVCCELAPSQASGRGAPRSFRFTAGFIASRPDLHRSPLAAATAAAPAVAQGSLRVRRDQSGSRRPRQGVEKVPALGQGKPRVEKARAWRRRGSGQPQPGWQGRLTLGGWGGPAWGVGGPIWVVGETPW